jgi:hypothetical protein
MTLPAGGCHVVVLDLLVAFGTVKVVDLLELAMTILIGDELIVMTILAGCGLFCRVELVMTLGA